MKVLKRSEILIIDSNLEKGASEWKESKAYAENDECEFEKFIYKALKASTGIKPNADDKSWQKLRVSNEWACFDYYLNTISSAQGEIDLTFKAMSANAIYLNGVRAKRLIIECLDTSGAVIESFEKGLFNESVSSWSEYFFGDWVEKDKAYDVFYECKSLSRSRIFRVRASGLDRVEIGSIIAGVAKSLATTLYAKNSISMIDFSKVSTDEEGNTQLEKGNFKRTNAFELLVDENELDFVMSELTNLRGEACVFIIADNFECLMNFAFLKNHELLLSKRGKSVISVEIEGLV